VVKPISTLVRARIASVYMIAIDTPGSIFGFRLVSKTEVDVMAINSHATPTHPRVEACCERTGRFYVYRNPTIRVSPIPVGSSSRDFLPGRISGGAASVDQDLISAKLVFLDTYYMPARPRDSAASVMEMPESIGLAGAFDKPTPA
jgi:hypothetical protein